MALCLVPSVKFNTETEASQFLNHIRDVYDVTYKDEAACRAYCWFRKNGDPSIVQGFEFYENENALAITHRSSDPYKKMRQFLATVQIRRPNGITHQPPSSMTPVVDSLRDKNTVLRFEELSYKLTITKLEVCSHAIYAESTFAQVLESLQNLAFQISNCNTTLACFVGMIEENDNDQSSGNASLGAQKMAHFSVVECYSSESSDREQFERRSLCLANITKTVAARVSITDCTDGFGYMRGKQSQ